jgi:subtilisin family serine protease
LGQRAAHRAASHPLARRVGHLTSAILAASLAGTPLVVAGPSYADTSTQWPLQYLKASQDWGVTKGSGVTVAVLDTGVTAIPDTQGNLLSGADFTTGGSSSSGNGQGDLDGHGTGMAVLIAGSGSTYEGLAPAAKILPVRVITGSGFGEADNVAAGIQYAITQHVQVINMSLYVSPTDANLATAVQDAENAGIVVVAASGNQSSTSVDYPAAYAGIVAVSAVDQSGKVASFSNSGSQVALAAPGVNVPTEDETGATGTADGTSASTAYVSATVALIRAAHPTWTSGQVIRDLISTADPASGMTAGQHSNQYGYGIVDPLKALQASAPSETSNPLGSAPAGGGAASAAATASPTTSASKASSTSNLGLVIGVVAAIAFALVIALIVVANRKNRNRPGGPGSFGPGAGQPYVPYPTQAPYQQQGPQGYEQQQYPQPPGPQPPSYPR